MVAIGMDANNNIYPISIVVVEAETGESWTWFFEALLADLSLSGPYGWAFLSDKQNVSISILLFCMIYMSCR
jgi:hypothetical protein